MANDSMKSVIRIICLVCLGMVVNGRLLTSPSNTVVMESHSVTLTCMTDTPVIKWSVIPFGQPGVVNDVTNASCALARSYLQYSVDTTRRGQCDLIIANTSSADAGTYTCTDGTLTSVAAQLTVLTSPLTCRQTPDSSYLPENVSVVTQCSIGFIGTHIPSLKWSGPTPNTTSETQVFGDPTNKIMSTLTVTTLPPPSVYGPYECTVQFPESTKHAKYSWKSSTTMTSYCPTNITISPPGGVLLVDTLLTCNSVAVPTATYQWVRRFADGTESMEQQNNRPLPLTHGNYTVECVATNYLRSETEPCSRRSTVHVEVFSGSSTTSESVTTASLRLKMTAAAAGAMATSLHRSASVIIAWLVGLLYCVNSS